MGEVMDLVAIIAAVCMFSDPKVSKDYKIMCMEEIVNCAVDKNAEVSEKKLQECIKEQRNKK